MSATGRRATPSSSRQVRAGLIARNSQSRSLILLPQTFNALAQAATGTGQAFNATTTIAEGGTGVASGTGSAGNAAANIQPNAAAASGTGAAFNAHGTISVGGTGAATGTG